MPKKNMKPKMPETNASDAPLLTKIVANLENFLIMAVAVLGLIVSFTAKWGGGAKQMNAGVFPRILFVLLAIGAVGMFFSKNKYEAPPKDRNIHPLFTIVFLAWVYSYVYCALHVGFVVSTAVFLIVTMSVVTVDPLKHWKGTIISTTIATVIIWGVFVKVLGIPLPNAILF